MPQQAVVLDPSAAALDPSIEQKYFALARTNLAVYCWIVHGILPEEFHLEWIHDFEAVERGEIDRLLIIAPPGSAKSTYLACYQEWYLGRHPERSLLFFTSQDTMAKLFGNSVKMTLEENPRYARVFSEYGCRPNIKRGWSSVDGMFLQATPLKDPAYRSLGYGASSIGSRSHGIILDDPLTQQENESETEMEKAKIYYDGTVVGRLHEPGWIISVMTSWNDHDLAHWLAAKQ